MFLSDAEDVEPNNNNDNNNDNNHINSNNDTTNNNDDICSCRTPRTSSRIAIKHQNAAAAPAVAIKIDNCYN